MGRVLRPAKNLVMGYFEVAHYQKSSPLRCEKPKPCKMADISQPRRKLRFFLASSATQTQISEEAPCDER